MRSATRAKLADSVNRMKYREFILAQPCIICELHNASYLAGLRTEPWKQTTRTEGAHIGPGGRATEGNSGAGKSPDRRMLPICQRHHRQDGMTYSLHRLGRNFWTLHALDPEKLIAEFNARFDAGERAA